MPCEVVRILPADADVEHRPFAHEPRVAAEVALEEQLGDLGRHGAGARLLGVELELDLLRGDHGLGRALRARELARDRAEVTAGAHQQRRAQSLPFTSHEPAIAAQLAQRLAEKQLRAAAREQCRVELAAEDPVAHDLGVGDARALASGQTHFEAADRLQHAPARLVLGGLELELGQDLRRDPAGAHLVARELLRVEERHAQAQALELPARRWSPPVRRRRSARRSGPLAPVLVQVRAGPGQLARAAAVEHELPELQVADVERRESSRRDTGATCARSVRRSAARPPPRASRSARASVRASSRSAGAGPRRRAPRGRTARGSRPSPRASASRSPGRCSA